MNFRPYVLLEELVYECPLHCPYCSNPVHYPQGTPLTTEEWQRVLGEAAKLGVLHVGFSGGEPLLRSDLETIIQTARAVGLYTNLITSAVGLTGERIAKLKAVGLDSVQISFQAEEAGLADSIAGAKVHARKLAAAQSILEAKLPLTLNMVLHRANIDRLAEMIDLAHRLKAKRLELANVQYYGWAAKNQAHLLPTKAQAEKALAVALKAKEQLQHEMEILYVFPDFHQDRPKPCMQGWGQRYLTVNPIGQVLPCPNAFSIPNLKLENVREKSLSTIWKDSESFNRFRGTEWMPEPCQSCPQREIDFGGCRCQAALLTGNANATDPVCSLSPDHHRIESILESIEQSQENLQWDKRLNPV